MTTTAQELSDWVWSSSINDIQEQNIMLRNCTQMLARIEPRLVGWGEMSDGSSVLKENQNRRERLELNKRQKQMLGECRKLGLRNC